MVARSLSFLTLTEPRWETQPDSGVDVMWLYGPTASGKSALALSIAARLDAVIINADASQLYTELPILSAQPSPAEFAQVPHMLYSALKGTEPTSAGIWLGLVQQAIEETLVQKKLPLLVGGTGMYLHSLLHGIAPIPAIAPEIRIQLMQELTAQGLPALYAELQTRDPALAARLKPGDTQRILRALEVVRGSEAPLSHWQSVPRVRILPHLNYQGLLLLPEREAVYARIHARADAMWPGAVEEIRALHAMQYPPDAPVMKTIGAAEISAYLRGDSTEADARALLAQYTRNYAKRQFTWARGQFSDLSSA